MVAGLDAEKALQHRAHEVCPLGWVCSSVPVCSARRRLVARSLTGFDFGGFKNDQNEDLGAGGGGLGCRFPISLGVKRGSCLVGGCGCTNCWGCCESREAGESCTGRDRSFPDTCLVRGISTVHILNVALSTRPISAALSPRWS